MKRSKAIEIINNQIEGFMNPSSSRHIAQRILGELEEAGMVAPLICKGDICCQNEWEPEDD